MNAGREVPLLDPARKPPHWMEWIQPPQCAVFLQDHATSSPLRSDGRPLGEAEAATCVVFDRVDDAMAYSEAKVAALPHVRCVIYDSHGLMHPPLAEVVNPSLARKRSYSLPGWARRPMAVALALGAIPLVWVDIGRESPLILPTLLAVNFILAAGRLMMWNAEARGAEQDRRKRLAEQRAAEAKAR